jgi:hypothetical protein
VRTDPRAGAAADERAAYWEARRALDVGRAVFELLVVPPAAPWPTLDGLDARGVAYVVLPRPGSDAAGLAPDDALGASSRRRLREELVSSPRARIRATLLAAEQGLAGPDLEIWQILRAPAQES